MTTALEKPDMNTEELLAGQTITPAEEEQNSVQSTSRLSREEIIDSLRKLVPLRNREICWNITILSKI